MNINRAEEIVRELQGVAWGIQLAAQACAREPREGMWMEVVADHLDDIADRIAKETGLSGLL